MDEAPSSKRLKRSIVSPAIKEKASFVDVAGARKQLLAARDQQRPVELAPSPAPGSSFLLPETQGPVQLAPSPPLVMSVTMTRKSLRARRFGDSPICSHRCESDMLS